ncbi:Hypothetical predicted protein [Podarcis lilfordi]|uniref:Endonuclease/exonuclease/phosphatase domain-containing protein n=1 Tax=Podarcis lilfordi TaxID=74358 RepID=A0AA35QQM6_9SAUR|nr:Hypothetical predicted protein [Podarcis lilfordi]
MAIRLNLEPLNGCCPPDIPGEYTHLGIKSNSVLDYLLASSDLISKALSFKIGNIHYSDHLPLAATFDLDWHGDEHGHPTQLDTNAENPVEGINTALRVKGIKWSVTQAQKYSEFFQQEIIQTYSALGITSYDHDQTINLFANLLNDLTSFFSVPTHQANWAHPKTGAPWFNRNCKQAKQHLCAIYNDYKSSGAITLPKEYYQAKSAYKYVQKKAKQEWQLNRWQALIAASSTRNSRKFWLLVNRKSKRYPLTVIPAPIWESFLRNYFALPDLNINTIDGVYEQLPLWPPTDPEEIHGLISNLKIGKAPVLI